MKFHCIRHEPFEGLASIEDWIVEKKGQISCTYTFLNQHFPAEFDFDMLIIMGGTASVYEDDVHDWLKEEKAFIQQALKKDKKILGICLGAQLLASVMGARVYPGKEKEIGWFPVQFNSEAQKRYAFLPDELQVFHWHGDTFDLPKGSLALASSHLTPNQGFVFRDRVWGLQFHLEMTPDSLNKMVKACPDELSISGQGIQSAEQILDHKQVFAETNSLMFNILEYLSTLT